DQAPAAAAAAPPGGDRAAGHQEVLHAGQLDGVAAAAGDVPHGQAAEHDVVIGRAVGVAVVDVDAVLGLPLDDQVAQFEVVDVGELEPFAPALDDRRLAGVGRRHHDRPGRRARAVSDVDAAAVGAGPHQDQRAG